MHTPGWAKDGPLRRRSWTVRDFALLLLVAPICAYLALYGICLLCPPTQAGKEPRQVAIRGHEMIVQGPVDAALASAVKAALATSHTQVDTVLLASFGGIEDAADRVAAELAQFAPSRIVVPSGFHCESACLLIVRRSKAQFDPADDAKLMFHREWSARFLGTCLACETLNVAENTFWNHAIGPTWHRSMQVWANDLAPGLGEALARCDPNPFDTPKGVTITGLQFKRFRAGDGSVACPFQPRPANQH